MTWNDVAIKFVVAVIPLLVMLLTLAVGRLAGLLKEQAKKVKSEVASKALLDAIGMGETKALEALAATQQLLVDDLKAASEDGKLTKDEAKQVMQHAIAYWREHIGVDALAVLQAAYGPIEQWLESYLEAKLGMAKWGKEAYDLTVPPSSPANEPAPGPTE